MSRARATGTEEDEAAAACAGRVAALGGLRAGSTESVSFGPNTT